MPALINGPVLSTITNGISPAVDHPSRKSHDKTISGLFTYTDLPNADGRSEPRRSHIKPLRSSSQNSLSAGLPVNYARPSRDWLSNIENTSPSLNQVLQKGEYFAPSSHSFESVPKLAHAVETGLPKTNGYPIHSKPTTPIATKILTASPRNSYTTSVRNVVPLQTDGHSSVRSASTSLPEISPLAATSRPSSTVEPRVHEFPHLQQRHTLQVPQSATSIRESHDFSINSVHSTGRFSPTKDQDTTLRRRRASLGLIRRSTRVLSDAHPEEVPHDEDAARWTEMIKQKRASRRQRKEEEDDDNRVVVGRKIEEGHVNWVTAYNMLTGIRFTVSRTNAKVDRDLDDADFEAKVKLSFDVTGAELTPSAKYDFKFKDYSPWVFRHLRTMFGLDPADYLMSLTSKYILSELGSPGKSGSFFYFSRDYKYIIKTIHHAEHKLLRKILKDYYQHVKNNPNTLISQFYGLHRVKIPYGRKIHFVVMNNLFPPHRDIHHTFDLKGSTIGRDYKEEDLAENPRATLKDLNWLRRGLQLEFEQTIRNVFIQQLQKDVALLQRLHIMDYSLLVGMHDVGKGNDENLRENTLKVYQPGGEKDDDDLQPGLLRTPSRLESARKARELRHTLKTEKPMPIGQMRSKMPDELRADDERQNRIFYSDDGGIRATHEDGSPGDTVYYLGVIDCLTHYGFLKRLEHIWKGLSNNSSQISPIPPYAYGERFLNFITGISITKEEAARKSAQMTEKSDINAHNAMHHHHIPPADGTVENNEKEGEKVALSPMSSPRSSTAVDTTMLAAQKSTDQQTSEKGRRASEEEVPNKTLLTTEDNARPSTTLPVVKESAESSRTPSTASQRLQVPTKSDPLDESGLQAAAAFDSNHDNWPHRPIEHNPHPHTSTLLDHLHIPHTHDHHANADTQADIEYLVTSSDGRAEDYAFAPIKDATIKRDDRAPARHSRSHPADAADRIPADQIGIAR